MLFEHPLFMAPSGIYPFPTGNRDPFSLKRLCNWLLSIGYHHHFFITFLPQNLTKIFMGKLRFSLFLFFYIGGIENLKKIPI